MVHNKTHPTLYIVGGASKVDKGIENSRRPGSNRLLCNDVYQIIQGGQSFERGPIV